MWNFGTWIEILRFDVWKRARMCKSFVRAYIADKILMEI